MATMTIKYDPDDALVQTVIQLIHQIKSIKILEDSEQFVPNATTIAAMEEARTADLKTYDNVQEMMNDILG